MIAAMSTFVHHFELAAPLFLLVLLGYVLARSRGFPRAVSDGLSRFVFSVSLPALLFTLMSDLSQLPPADYRIPLVYFGGCFVVFAIGRVIAARLFALDGTGQSIFGLGGIFSNNVLLGVPLAKVTIGDAAMPAVAVVLVFNALLLWTLVTLSIEWARQGDLSPRGFANTARNVITNPVVASILLGTAFGLSGLALPHVVAEPLRLIGQSATPLALVVLGMGLVEFGVAAGWRQGAAIAALKLLAAPLVVWLLARLTGLSDLHTQVVVLLASLSVGVNVYLMAREFDALQSAVAASIVISTALAAVTTPLALSLTG
jgi:predicted permease